MCQITQQLPNDSLGNSHRGLGARCNAVPVYELNTALAPLRAKLRRTAI